MLQVIKKVTFKFLDESYSFLRALSGDSTEWENSTIGSNSSNIGRRSCLCKSRGVIKSKFSPDKSSICAQAFPQSFFLVELFTDSAQTQLTQLNCFFTAYKVAILRMATLIGWIQLRKIPTAAPIWSKLFLRLVFEHAFHRQLC